MSRYRILIVDDDDDVRSLLVATFRTKFEVLYEIGVLPISYAGGSTPSRCLTK